MTIIFRLSTQTLVHGLSLDQKAVPLIEIPGERANTHADLVIAIPAVASSCIHSKSSESNGTPGHVSV